MVTMQSLIPTTYTMCTQFPLAGDETAAIAFMKRISKKTTPAEFELMRKEFPAFNPAYGAPHKPLGLVTILHIAVREGNFRLTEHICQIYKDFKPPLINIGTSPMGMTPLCLSLREQSGRLSNEKSFRMAQILLAAGADINCAFTNESELKVTALMTASARLHSKFLLLYLIKNRAPVTKNFFETKKVLSESDQLSASPHYIFKSQILKIEAALSHLKKAKKNCGTQNPFDYAIQMIKPIVKSKIHFQREGNLFHLKISLVSSAPKEDLPTRTWHFRPITHYNGTASSELAKDLYNGVSGIVNVNTLNTDAEAVFSINWSMGSCQMWAIKNTINYFSKYYDKYLRILSINLPNEIDEVTMHAENQFVNFYKQNPQDIYPNEITAYKFLKNENITYIFKLGTLVSKLCQEFFVSKKFNYICRNSKEFEQIATIFFSCFVNGLEAVNEKQTVYHPDDFLSHLSTDSKNLDLDVNINEARFPNCKIIETEHRKSKQNDFYNRHFKVLTPEISEKLIVYQIASSFPQLKKL